MIVVSDTSPINYLIEIDCIHILEILFERVVLPEAVIEELRSPGAPPSIKDWLSQIPDWITIQQSENDLDTKGLDPGEREAINLAEKLKADFVLIDEKKGRLERHRRGLAVIGTLGILDRAANRQLIDLAKTVDQLKRTTFRVSPEILEGLVRHSKE